MPSDGPASADGSAALDVLVGEWTEQVLLPGTPAGRVVFEWTLDRRFLLQRSETPQPEFPDHLAVISPDQSSGDFVQHYFDSRGVVRLYRMQLRDRLWTLKRTTADFSPLHFSQQFEGLISDDGNTIDARWETSHDGGATWELDFRLRFTRIR